MSGADLLDVRDLTVAIESDRGTIIPVDAVSFRVAPGRTLALVGESGSGKSLTCLSLVRVLPRRAPIIGGRVIFQGRDLLAIPDAEMARLRGRDIGMVLQDPTTALNPLVTAGAQIGEMFRYHTAMRRREWWQAVVATMRSVHIPAPDQRARDYPFQFSGGMRQRLAIAMAIACKPSLLIVDEPTTALDVTIRLQILRLLREIQQQHGTSIVFVTHDLQLVSYFCDDVAVMYAGRIVEQGPVEQVFAGPRHPYTAALLATVPRLSQRGARLATIEGQPPSFVDLPPGCRFAPRCARTTDICQEVYPPIVIEPGGRGVACWHALEAT